MKTLSIRQPWAYAILHLGKNIENRDWYTAIRGRFIIHAGKSYDEAGRKWIETTFGMKIPADLPCGGIVGEVEIINCMQKSDSKWFFGKYGFVLRNPVALPFVPCRGQLGFFEIPDGVIKR